MPNSYGTHTALSGNANSLANGAFVSMGQIDFGSAPPHECFVEFALQAAATPSTSTSRSVLVFARTSLDGTNYSDAGSSANELNLLRIGSVSLVDTSAHRSRAFALARHFGGALPPKVEIVLKNDLGQSLAASGQTGAYRTETFG